MFGIRSLGLAATVALIVCGSCDFASAAAVIDDTAGGTFSGSGGTASVVSITSYEVVGGIVGGGRPIGHIPNTSRTDADGRINTLTGTDDVINVMELNVDFTELQSSFSLTFGTFGTSFGVLVPDLVAGDTVEYLVVLNVTNSMTAINGSTASLNSLYLTIEDGGIGSSDGLSFKTNEDETGLIAGTRQTGNSGGHLQGGGAVSAKVLQFGGKNGGGGGIAQGETGTVLAGVLTVLPTYATGFGSFKLTFTSNPEPGTMILGGVGLLIGGVGGYRRRRKAKAQTEQAA